MLTPSNQTLVPLATINSNKKRSIPAAEDSLKGSSKIAKVSASDRPTRSWRDAKDIFPFLKTGNEEHDKAVDERWKMYDLTGVMPTRVSYGSRDTRSTGILNTVAMFEGVW